MASVHSPCTASMPLGTLSSYSGIVSYIVVPSLLAGSLLGCDEPIGCTLVYVGHVQSAIQGGGTVGAAIGATASELDAVVQLQIYFGIDGEFADICTGTFTDSETILFAKHCLHDGRPTSITLFGDRIGMVDIAEPDTTIHPTEDIALLSIQGRLGPAEPKTLPILRDPNIISPGDLVQLAGYGLDDDLQSSALRLSIGRVVDLNDKTIRVTADGLGGACDGDSGGPLLIRDTNGRVAIAGVLSAGTVSCRGEDTYVATDAFREWFELHSAEDVDTKAGNLCSTLTARGMCYNGRSIYCDGDLAVAEVCRGETVCGWDRSQDGHRCIPQKDDACHGIDELGICKGNRALRCVSGVIFEANCSECAAECVRSPRTGNTVCFKPSLNRANE